MAFTHLQRGMLAIVLVALPALRGCARVEPEFPSYSPEQGNPLLLTDEDIAVYEAVIAAYAQVGEILGTRLSPRVRGTEPISPQELERLSSEHGFRMRPYTSRSVTVDPQPDRWRTLTGVAIPRLPVATTAVANFNERNDVRASLERFHPKHLRVIWSTEVETLNGLYCMTLPGYSASHGEAIVEVSVTLAALAGGGELIYLKRIEGSWKVIAKQQTWIS